MMCHPDVFQRLRVMRTAVSEELPLRSRSSSAPLDPPSAPIPPPSRWRTGPRLDAAAGRREARGPTDGEAGGLGQRGVGGGGVGAGPGGEKPRRAGERIVGMRRDELGVELRLGE